MFRQTAGPTYRPVEIGERCLLSDKPPGEYTISLRAHKRVFSSGSPSSGGSSWWELPIPGGAGVAAWGWSSWRVFCSVGMGVYLRSEPKPPVPAELLRFGWSLLGLSLLLWSYSVVVLHCYQGTDRGRVVVKVKDNACTMEGILFSTQVAVIKLQNAGDWKLIVVMK